jgi:perosamine synthetase
VGEEEIAAVTRVLRGSVLTNGPETEAFEHEFAAYHSSSQGVAFANGTVALVGLLTALGIGPGDEVIVPSLTFVSSATSVLLVGATPVFADVDEETFNLSPSDVARRLGPRVKAILAVHYGGQPADMAELAEISSAAGVLLLEDAAEAHGAQYRGRHVGKWGLAAMFSFTPTKNITTGEGGMILTDDEDLATRLRLLRNHGQTAPYVHSIVGSNWRITEMQAAMGRAQVGKLSGILARKLAVADEMDRLIADIPAVEAPLTRPDRDHVHMLYTVKLESGPEVRDRVILEMRRRGIETRVYFPPVHRQPIFADNAVDLPVTDDLAGRIMSLPIHSRLTLDEVAEVAAALAESLDTVCVRTR